MSGCRYRCCDYTSSENQSRGHCECFRHCTIKRDDTSYIKELPCGLSMSSRHPHIQRHKSECAKPFGRLRMAGLRIKEQTNHHEPQSLKCVQEINDRESPRSIEALMHWECGKMISVPTNKPSMAAFWSTTASLATLDSLAVEATIWTSGASIFHLFEPASMLAWENSSRPISHNLCVETYKI